MNGYIAFCGLDCEKCDARIATVNDDNELRKKVASEWSKLNNVEITPLMINCTGCRIEGVKTPFCGNLCEIRKCAISGKHETCGCCSKIESCEKIKMIFSNNEEAIQNLKG